VSTKPTLLDAAAAAEHLAPPQKSSSEDSDEEVVYPVVNNDFIKTESGKVYLKSPVFGDFLKIMSDDNTATLEHSDTMNDNRKSLFNTMRMREEMAEEPVDPKYVRLQAYLTGTFHTRLVSIVIVACLWLFALAEYLV